MGCQALPCPHPGRCQDALGWPWTAAGWPHDPPRADTERHTGLETVMPTTPGVGVSSLLPMKGSRSCSLRHSTRLSEIRDRLASAKGEGRWGMAAEGPVSTHRPAALPAPPSLSAAPLPGTGMGSNSVLGSHPASRLWMPASSLPHCLLCLLHRSVTGYQADPTRNPPPSCGWEGGGSEVG